MAVTCAKFLPFAYPTYESYLQVRSEALTKVSAIISEATFITAEWGELPNALNSRLSDTNKNLVLETVKVRSQYSLYQNYLPPEEL